MQPSEYINTIFVPKDGQIPIDINCLAAQGIFDVVFVFFLDIIVYTSMRWYLAPLSNLAPLAD